MDREVWNGWDLGSLLVALATVLGTAALVLFGTGHIL